MDVVGCGQILRQACHHSYRQLLAVYGTAFDEEFDIHYLEMFRTKLAIRLELPRLERVPAELQRGSIATNIPPFI